MAINYNIREQLPSDAIVFDNHAYDNSIIGITLDGRAIYDFDKMVKELMEDEKWEEIDAVEWITYNTMRSLPYAGDKRPLVVYTEEDL